MPTLPPSQRLKSAEIWCEDAWRAIGIEEARRTPSGTRLRCIACHGQVAAHGNFTARSEPYLQHRRPHDGCPYLFHRFNGISSQHPQALR